MIIPEIKIFICFAADDRYNIAEPIVYHLKNYGIEIWYDRHALLMGDNRIEKNLIEGASQCNYTIAIISKNTINSPCTLEELSITKERCFRHEVIVFPVLYEITPTDIPSQLQWIKEFIFKEVDRHSGTRTICNHIACRITGDLLNTCEFKTIGDVLTYENKAIPGEVKKILTDYQKIDYSNLNSRITLLYSAYLIFNEKLKALYKSPKIISKIFERLFSETRLNITVDYRELWLLENSICILANCYIESSTDFRISTTISTSESI